MNAPEEVVSDIPVVAAPNELAASPLPTMDLPPFRRRGEDKTGAVSLRRRAIRPLPVMSATNAELGITHADSRNRRLRNRRHRLPHVCCVCLMLISQGNTS